MAALMPATDPVTLIAALVAVFSVATVIWLLIASGLKESAPACLCLAGANALLAGALLLIYLLGAALPEQRWWPDLLFLGAFGLILVGIPWMAEAPTRWQPAGIAVVVVAGALTQFQGLDHVLGHQVLLDGAIGLMCLVSAFDTFRLLRQRDLKPQLAWVFALPFLLLGLLLLSRPVVNLLTPGATRDIDVPTSFNTVWLWAVLVVTLVLNGSLAFLLLMKLVLQIRRLTLRDPLTDALNRRAVTEAMELEHHRLARGHVYALVLLDMDRFKQLNDTLGHAAGDAALKTLVKVLQPCLREVDLLGRLGGEEFCALLPYTGIAGAALVAERMRHLLEAQDFTWEGEVWPLTASFGITEASVADADPSAVMWRADRALYQAKSQGRNVVQAVELVDQKSP